MELGDIDYTDVLMKDQKLIIFVFYNISKTNNDAIVGLKETVELAVINDYKVIGLTASGEIDVNSFESENDFFTWYCFIVS